jgi:hypothetical protein
LPDDDGLMVVIDFECGEFAALTATERGHICLLTAEGADNRGERVAVA